MLASCSPSVPITSRRSPGSGVRTVPRGIEAAKASKDSVLTSCDCDVEVAWAGDSGAAD